MTAPRPIALTIGVFDGLHRGHQAVIAATVAAAREREGSAWVATFDPHPDTVVRGSDPRPWITPPEERAALLHAMGIDRVEVVRFDREVQALTPEQFLDRILGPGAPLAALVLGPDFRMGKNRVGDARYLESLGARRGFVVREVPFLVGNGDKLSSTLLRREIGEGKVEEAEAIMGRPYALEGRVGGGAGRGTGLGYPTANLEIHPQKLLPAAGIYLSENELSGKTWHGMTYVGSAATFGPGPVRVEVHLLDFQGSLRGKTLKTLLIGRLRADRIFDSPGALVEAMNDDLARARAHWNTPSRGRESASRRP
ncbi:MAG TPA: riboflavin biosynthesis protein RibF [Candidatus Eisenbacteria bacterium]